MCKALKVDKAKAQNIIIKLREKKLINTKYKIERKEDYILIPINIKYLEENKKLNKYFKEFKDKKSIFNYKIIDLEKKIKQKQKSKKLKDILKEKKLPINIINKINTAYDIVGDIIIIGIDNLEEKYYKIIGESLIKLHPHVKTVLNKTGKHHGIFRTQDMQHIFGENKKETIIKENNCKIKIDVEKVFCSTRLSFERTRITKLVKENEIVGVFFAGAGPFALAITKNKNPKEVIGIELNPLAIKYFKENIKLNKLDTSKYNKIEAILGDVKEKSNNYINYFNRVIMPLPKSAELFLEDAIKCGKNNSVIHIYRFVPKNDPYSEIKKILEEKSKKNKVKLNIINKRIIRSYSPSIVQIVLDIKLEKK